MPADPTGPMRWGGAFVLRTAPFGGDVRSSVFVAGDPTRHRRLVLFVHGFNVPHDAACAAYGEMHARLWGRADARDQLGNVFWVFWPGDVAGRSGDKKSVLSPAHYFSQVRRVRRELADALYEKLRALPVRPGNDLHYPREILFVAHSLGTRLTLETVFRLQGNEAAAGVPEPSPEQKRWMPRVAGIVLMAAAVPEGMCEPGSDPARHRFFRSPGEQARPGELPPQESILYSRKDDILRWAFRPGQRMAGEAWGQAVGRAGKPGNRWGQSRVKAPYNHGDYWGDRGGGGSQAIAAVATHFGALRTRPLPENDLDRSVLPSAGDVDARHLRERPLGDLCAASRQAYITA